MAAAVGVSSDVEWWNLTGTSSVIGTSPRRENVEDAAPHAIGFSVALAQRGVRLHEIEMLKGYLAQNGHKSRRMRI